MAQKRSLINLVLGSLYPCFLFSSDNKDIPLRMRLRRKQNRIWLCRHISAYVKRWYLITIVLGVFTTLMTILYGFTLATWCVVALFIISLISLYLIIEVQDLHPPELESELLKQLSKHDINDF